MRGWARFQAMKSAARSAGTRAASRAGNPASAWSLRRVALACLAGLVGVGGSGQAGAQYKVVGPDGKVTYTDKPVANPSAQVQPLRQSIAPAAGGQPPASTLPALLRPLVDRFPVTLYSSTNCTFCEAARKLLQQRGVPYGERSVGNDDDIAALQRLTGGRSVPSLTVGAEALRGFLDADWQDLLDLAGYPRDSRLPRNYPAPAATPLVARAPIARALPPPEATAEPADLAAPVAPVAPAAPAAPGAIRF